MSSEAIPQELRRPRPLIVVIKLGTSSIVDEKTHEPLLPILTLIVDTAAKLRKDGHKVVIVSSGAIGVGLRRMDVAKRPKHLSQLQASLQADPTLSHQYLVLHMGRRALAAIGQCRLISLWDSLFAHLSQPVAQVLLTRNDIADRTRYLNAQNTFHELLDMGVIPIVNENDTLAVSEIKFGDNDTLSAITAAMIHADLLFLMTDVDCLYDKNPRHHPDAKPIEIVEDISELEADVSSAGSALGTGGMSTKIIAARLGTSAGVTTIITRSSNPGNILGIVRYLNDDSPQGSNPTSTPPLLPRSQSSAHLKQSAAASSPASLSERAREPAPAPPLHTRFLPSLDPIRDRHFWLLHTPNPHGTVYIDHGAERALLGKASLLPVGVLGVEGNFAQQDVIRLVVVKRRTNPGPNEKRWEGTPSEIGRAIVNYAAPEITRIMGHQSIDIASILGYADSEYVAHRSHISIFRQPSRAGTPTRELR
ncbi:putative glutamate 5-kinase [Escovopsis weberi]|uniref:Putative glutamate 5-kinase n=1 Tax=Escovopsis weberi TaxID=150374 RepID=A0A0M8MYW1_ESCWE|nr:putative glutamate 5-kinase [Escovopsis weberi]